MEIKAIDVSSDQGKPDWTKVAKSGIKVAILRVHQRYGVDSSFEHNNRTVFWQGHTNTVMP